MSTEFWKKAYADERDEVNRLRAHRDRLNDALAVMAERLAKVAGDRDRLRDRLDEACEQFDPGEERAQTAAHQERAARAESERDELRAEVERLRFQVERFRNQADGEREARLDLEVRHDAVRSLVAHCWIHSGYQDCGYAAMTTEEKALYDEIVGRNPGGAEARGESEEVS